MRQRVFTNRLTSVLVLCLLAVYSIAVWHRSTNKTITNAPRSLQNRKSGKAALTLSHHTGRILIFVTTHLSEQHYAFLKKCWPPLLRRLPLFQMSDFAIYINRNGTSQAINTALINAVFASHRVTTHIGPNPGYQEGAILALTEGFARGWFDGYDWVVRVNPDVLIRDDLFLLTAMANKNISGIFVDCLDRLCPAGHRCTDRLIHSDFFAVRPGAISKEALLAIKTTHAESMATQAFRGIVRSGSDAWLPGSGPHHADCRVSGRLSPVIHDHAYLASCDV